MAMALRIVIPPHPLIRHWLSILRMDTTPPAIYATALSQLGKWLSYEAIRDWLPNKTAEITTKFGTTEGKLIDPTIPIYVKPNLPGGLELWQGGRDLLPNAILCLGETPGKIKENSGVIIYYDQITNGASLIKILNQLREQNISSSRIRVITALAASPGLTEIGEIFPELTIYAGCIDQELKNQNEIIPGIGNPEVRLNTIITEQD